MDASRPPLSRGTFVAGAATLLAAAAARPARAQGTPITVGTIPADTSAVVNYAQELGYYKAAGIDVRIEMMNSGPVIANAVTGGSLDAGGMNIGSLAVARSRGVPLKVIAPEAMCVPGSMTDVIMVRKDSPIKTGADFNGKTVGIVAEKTMQHAAFLLWVDKHGGNSKTVGFVEIPFPEMVTALDQKRVDAIIPVEPFTSAGRANNRVLGSVYASMPPRFLIFGIVATERWLNANPRGAAKLAASIRRASAWANGHEKASADLLVRVLKLKPETARSMARAHYGTTLDTALIQPVIDVMRRYGILTENVAASELIWRPPSA